MITTVELARSALFRGALSLSGTYSGLFSRCTYERRARIFAQGDKARMVHVLVTGAVRLSRLLSDGREVTLTILGPGDLLGEEALFGAGTRDLNATAFADCETLTVKGTELAALVKRHPSLALNLAGHINSRRSEAATVLEATSGGNVQERLLGVLQRLASQHGIDSSRGTKIALRLTHADIATFIGSTRETTTLELAKLDRMGIIRRERRAICLCS